MHPYNALIVVFPLGVFLLCPLENNGGIKEGSKQVVGADQGSGHWMR